MNGGFGTFHAAIKGVELLPILDSDRSRHPIVSHENNQGVFQLVPLFEFRHSQANIVVDIFNHAIASSCVWVISIVQEPTRVFFRGNHWSMRGIERNVSEVGLFGVNAVFHPSQSGMKEKVGAEALGLYDLLVVQQDVVEVAILIIGGKSPQPVWPIPPAPWIKISSNPRAWGRYSSSSPKVPFAKDSCFVSCVLQNLWKGDDIEVQMVAMTNGMGNAHLKGRPTTHQGTPGGRAGRADMKVIKPRAFAQSLSRWGVRIRSLPMQERSPLP
jgi:hypothetical protein